MKNEREREINAYHINALILFDNPFKRPSFVCPWLVLLPRASSMCHRNEKKKNESLSHHIEANSKRHDFVPS